MTKHPDERLASAMHKKTLDHNYLIFHMPDECGPDYQLNMISTNDISGLLPIQPHNDEEGAWLYYDHSSLQPLSRMFESRKINEDQIRLLIGRILDIYKNLENYLLDDSHIVLCPDYLYVDAYSLTPALVFLPFYDKPRNESLLELCEFLMEHCEHKGSDEDMLCYELYELLRLDSYVSDDIRRILEKKEEHITAAEPEVPESIPPKPAIINETGEDKQPAFPVIPLIPLIAGLIVLALPPSLMRQYPAGRVAGAALALTSAAAFLISLRKYLRAKKEGSAAAAASAPVNEYDRFFEDMPAGTGTPAPLPDEGYGRTIYIGNGAGEPEGILIEKNRKNEYPIPAYPCTIGKLKESSDLVLNDRSVSRIHAKILKKDELYYLQDLGSTNGTFINGVQLESEETVQIEKDDEIGIGRLRFILA